MDCRMHSRWPKRALLAALMGSMAVEVEAQISNQTQSSARQGLSISPTTTLQSATVINNSNRPSTTAFEKASSVDHNVPGCSHDCTVNVNLLTAHHNSWTKCLGTAMIGRIYYVVDSANNKTITSTSYAESATWDSGVGHVSLNVSDVLGSGHKILTRKDVNAAGTVTYMDGTNTIAYPTGYNRLPSFYVWNGTLPYIANSTPTCVTADSETSVLKTTHTVTFSYTTAVPSTVTSTWTKTDFVVGATPFPSRSNLPTQSVYPVDPEDPKGWKYCYDFGIAIDAGDSFYSLFSDDIFDQILNSCNATGGLVAPPHGVPTAQFLLEETTSYVDSPKTEESASSLSPTTKPSETQTSVLVDPFQSLSEPTDEETSSSTEETHRAISTTDKSTRPNLTGPASLIKPTETDKPAETDHTSSILQTTGLRPSETTRGNAVGPDTEEAQDQTKPLPSEVTEAQSRASDPQTSATGAGSLPITSQSAPSQSSASSSSVQLDALNSLIQEIGQLQSSSQEAAVNPVVTTQSSTDADGAISAGPAPISKESDTTETEPVTGGSVQTEPPTNAIIATSTKPAPIPIESTTITANSDGNYMIGTHTLQPKESAYEYHGTTYSFDTSKSALVVDGTSAYTAKASHAVPQASTLTLEGILATMDSESNYVVETQTLKPGGPAITVSGERISLVSDATAVMVGSETSALSPPSASSQTKGLGDYVWAGMAGETSPAAGAGASQLPSSSEEESPEPVQSFASSTTPPSTYTTKIESDGRTVVEGGPTTAPNITDSSSVRTTATDDASESQGPTSSANTTSTTSQPGVDMSTSTPDPSGIPSEGKADRIIVTAPLAIGIWSLVSFLLL